MTFGLFLLILIGAVVLTWLFLALAQEQPWDRLGHLRTPVARARALLRELLGEEAFQLLEQRGYIDIPSPSIGGRVYRVPYGPGQVEVLERGAFVAKLCIVTIGWIPPADRVITHKLLIEGDEERYLRTANLFPAIGSRRIGRWYP